MNWFQWIQFALLLAGQIVPILKAVEDAIGPGNGAVKKEIAMQAITATSPEMTAQQRTIVSALIDSQVASLNKTGALSGVKK